jgi:hypothetical protein
MPGGGPGPTTNGSQQGYAGAGTFGPGGYVGGQSPGPGSEGGGWGNPVPVGNTAFGSGYGPGGGQTMAAPGGPQQIPGGYPGPVGLGTGRQFGIPGGYPGPTPYGMFGNWNR